MGIFSALGLDGYLGGLANAASGGYYDRQDELAKVAQTLQMQRTQQQQASQPLPWSPEGQQILAQNPTAYSPDLSDPLNLALQSAQADPARFLPQVHEILQAQQAAKAPKFQLVQAGDGGYAVVDVNHPNAGPAYTQASVEKPKVHAVGKSLVQVTPDGQAKVLYQGQDNSKAQSGVGKLRADRESGLIDDETYNAALKKETQRPPRAYTQAQNQAAAFADRVINASKIIDDYETGGEDGKPKIDLVNNTSAFLSAVPSAGLGGYLGNAWLSGDQQKYKNAADQWIRANLRKESGAAISDKEMEQEYRNYFPVAGDSQKVIDQKRQLRATTANTLVQQGAGAYQDQYGGSLPSASKADSFATAKPGSRIKW